MFEDIIFCMQKPCSNTVNDHKITELLCPCFLRTPADTDISKNKTDRAIIKPNLGPISRIIFDTKNFSVQKFRFFLTPKTQKAKHVKKIQF